MAKISLESPTFRWLIAGFFAALYWVMAVTAVWDKSVTFDEVAHLTGGYTYWLRNDFRLNPESGMLPQRLGGLPLIFMHPAMPGTGAPAWTRVQETVLGAEMLFKSGNDATRLLMAGRMMIALLGAALVLLVYQWSSEIFGWRGGLLSALLCAFCPALLAHGALVTSDMAAAFFFTFATWAFWRMCRRVSPVRVIVCGLAFAGLVLSKMSGVIILPVMGVLLVIRLLSAEPLIVDFRGEHVIRSRSRIALIFCALGVVNVFIVAGGIWAAYSFRYGMLNPALAGNVTRYPDWTRFNGVTGVIVTTTEFARRHHLLPEGFLYGFAGTANSVQARSGFLNGAYSGVGFANFFPYAFLVKTPLAVFCLLAGAALTGLRRWKTSGRWLYAIAPLVVLFSTYWFFALRAQLNIGHRHLLPVYPVIYILAGVCGVYLKPGGKRWQALLVAAGLVWFVAESALIRPDYLTYFNVIAGGPDNGWRHLVDSSLDWGQDLPGLRRWLDAHGANKPDNTYVAYFGSGDPGYYGIDARVLSVAGNERAGIVPFGHGVYCISATSLQSIYTPMMGHWAVPYEKAYRVLCGMSGQMPEPMATGEKPAGLNREQVMLFQQLRFARLCSWLRQREPDAEIGHSILLYFLTDEQVHEALYGKPGELLPEVQIRMKRE